MRFPERCLQKTACFSTLGGTKIMLKDGAHLGRQDSLKRTRENLPKVFERAHKAVKIGGDSTISKNHALLLKEEDRWAIYDLNSRSGTYVNGVRIRPGEGVTLNKGDSVLIGRSRFIFSEEYPTLNAAVLVGKPGELALPNPTPRMRQAYAEGGKEDLALMREALVQRGFEDGNVITLFDRKATVPNVVEAIRSFSHLLSQDSLFVFYYHGHGGWRNLYIHPFLSRLSDRYVLGPDKLYDTLRELRGKKLVLLDCCNASSFLQDIPYRALVITGEDAKRHLYCDQVTGPLIPDILEYPRKNYRGMLTRAFLKALENRPESIDLKRIADELGGYRKLVKKKVDVFAEGNTVILPSIPGMIAAIREEPDECARILNIREILEDATRLAPYFPDGKCEDSSSQGR